MEMEKQKQQRPEEKEKVRQPKKRSRARRIAGEFIPRVFATDAIKEGAGTIGELWGQLADRRRHLADREKSEPADFKTLCEENELGEKELAERQAVVLRSKRLSWIFMVCMVVWSILGITALIIQGFGWFSVTICILCVPLSLLFFSWNFRYTLHLWQLERQEIAGIQAFFHDSGIWRLIRY